jgi:predicted acyl esterase
MVMVSSVRASVSPFGILTCAQNGKVLFCPGSIGTRVKSFDGVPLDVNVTLPLKIQSKLPLLILSHGYAGSKIGLDDTLGSRMWAQLGYAVIAASARGFGDSCGSQTSRDADPAGCQSGWVRLDDIRYEVRDIQYLAGLLVDQGIVDPQKVGVTGGSYGGGVSLEAAMLKDRIVDTDGTLRPWTSPNGTPMRIAGAAPYAPWSDLIYSLMPNGATLDYVITQPTDDLNPTGISKDSYSNSLFASGQASGFYAPPGADLQADLINWQTSINAGEPYDTNPEVTAIKDEIARHHSAYYIDASEPPAPILIVNGWTDDLFPVDEALRLYNRERADFPTAPISVMLLDFGHPRGQNKLADLGAFQTRLTQWLDHYVKGNRNSVLKGIEVLSETCPATARSGGPFSAANWAALHPGEVRFLGSDQQTFSSAGGDPAVASILDPISGGGACAQVTSANESNTANWILPASSGKGFTLMGAPTIIADLQINGDFAEVAGRLWDVAPDNTQTLVARGLYRPTANGPQVFQLHPGAWRFAAGHFPKLQLLGQDAPYGRASNGTFSIAISNLDLRLPVHEKPDCRQVFSPTAPLLPSGATLAPDVNPAGGPRCHGPK